MIALLFACTSSSKPVEPATPPTEPPPPAEQMIAPTEEPAGTDKPISEPRSPVGGWLSEGCGDRTYARYIEIKDGAAFSGEERISPCPEGANCMWSGIHTFTGTWSLAEESLTFEVTKTSAQGEEAAVWPTMLTYAGGRLLEGDCLSGPAPVKAAEGPR